MPFDSYSGEKFQGEMNKEAPLPTNHYEVLGVSKSASDEEIQKAYKKRLIEGMHEDKIAAMPEGDAKQVALLNHEALKVALDVLTNRKKRYEYDKILRTPKPKNDFNHNGAEASKQEKSENKGATSEKQNEWYDLAKAKLDLVNDEKGLNQVIEEFNSHYPDFDHMSTRCQFDKGFIVSVPEGDYKVMKLTPYGSVNGPEALMALPLTPYKIGEEVKVIRSSGEVESGWAVTGFSVSDKSKASERMVSVQKVTEQGIFRKTITAKTLRESNM